MNLQAIFDDLESEFDRLHTEPATLEQFAVRGYRSVTFGRDHFVGVYEATGRPRIVSYLTPIALRQGASKVTKHRLESRCQGLIGQWVEVQHFEGLARGLVLGFQNGLIMFRFEAVPLKRILSIELAAVDN